MHRGGCWPTLGGEERRVLLFPRLPPEPPTHGRSAWLVGRPAVCSNDEGEQGRAVDAGRGGLVGLVGETGIDSILCMVRGERPPPSPVLCPLPPPPPPPLSSSSPSRKPTHSGSPGQSSRPPAHCCFFEMGLSRFGCMRRCVPFFFNRYAHARVLIRKLLRDIAELNELILVGYIFFFAMLLVTYRSQCFVAFLTVSKCLKESKKIYIYFLTSVENDI